MWKTKVKKEESILPEIKEKSAISVANIESLEPKKAFARYTSEEQKEVTELANNIDVTKIENVMEYGSSIFEKSFEQSGNLLKSERYSNADQEVINQVTTLIKKVSKSNEDFDQIIKDPNPVEKFFLKVLVGSKKSRARKIQASAVTNYKLIIELKKHCESWEKLLFDAMGQITNSKETTYELTNLLEKYIVAGYIAEERINEELKEKEEKYKESGLLIDKKAYDDQKYGYDIFLNVMSNLEKSRVMFMLSMEELDLIKDSNINVQQAIKTKKNASLSIMAKQIELATLNAKNKEVIEGQRAIHKLNNELIVEFAKTFSLTAKQSKESLYAGIYDTECAKSAIQTVLDTYREIENISKDWYDKIKPEITELNRMVEEIEQKRVGVVQLPEGKVKTSSFTSTGLKF